MVGANLHGGLMLGAFRPDGEAVAMSFAFLGRIEGRLCLYSQLTGVVPGYQSRGLGYQIKIHQRDFARAEGIGSIAWAFDPLQAGNAHFNLVRLGATAGRYVDNMYGQRTDALNAGVPTDRLIAEWDTDPAAPRPDSDDRLGLRIEIPDDIARLRREQPDEAERWRSAVRDAFRSAFGAGYRAISIIREETATPRRVFYVLARSGGTHSPRQDAYDMMKGPRSTSIPPAHATNDP
jgi:predicted GNAT superfamily acetyltransferase